jgi:uncharacterized repeat protein (TIGR02543 family)
MKSWAIIATIFLIASLCLNVWYYTETTNLNTNIKQQNENLDLELGLEGDSKYRMPFETMYELMSNTNILVKSILGYRMQYFQSFQECDSLGDEKAITTVTHNLTISINGQGIINPGEGTHEYNNGTQVTITVSSISGWDFDHWSGDATGTSPTIVITMDSDKNVTAYFEDENSTSQRIYGCTVYGCR